jgi:phenylalanyl-tRNA synthetase alpha chain
MMRERLEAMKEAALAAAQGAGNADELLQIRHQYLGKKGELTLILKELGKLEPEERRQTGMLANEIKDAITQAITAREEALVDEGSAIQGEIDLTLPGIPPVSGGLHPITQMSYDLNDAFLSPRGRSQAKNMLLTTSTSPPITPPGTPWTPIGSRALKERPAPSACA